MEFSFLKSSEKENLGSYYKWPFFILVAAGLYNMIWGFYVVLIPSHFFYAFSIVPPTYIEIWQYMGGLVAIYGVAYLFSALNPFRFWPIILVGLLGKITLVMGFVIHALNTTFQVAFLVLSIFNHIIWIFPFMMILKYIYELKSSGDCLKSSSFEQSLSNSKTNHEQTIEELNRDRKVMLVFLRHLGCTFCRELLNEMSKYKSHILEKNMVPVLVHMTHHLKAKQILEKYDLEDMDLISDKERQLYKSFGLTRGKLYQLFGLRVLWKGFVSAIVKKNGIGPEIGDGLQMAGAFILEKNKVVKFFQPEYASEVLDIKEFIKSA